MQLDLSRFSPAERSTLQLRVLYEGAGYRKFRCSHFEEYSLYQQNERFLSDSQVITFTDLDGKLRAIKPDVTLSIAKNAQPAAGEHQGVLLPQKPGAGRQQLQLPRPPAGQPREAHPQLLPVPHRILHHAGQAWEGHTDLPHAVAAAQPGLVGQQGLVEQGQQGQGALQRQGGEPLLPFPAQNDRFQGGKPSFHTQFPVLLPEPPPYDTIL